MKQAQVLLIYTYDRSVSKPRIRPDNWGNNASTLHCGDHCSTCEKLTEDVGSLSGFSSCVLYIFTVLQSIIFACFSIIVSCCLCTSLGLSLSKEAATTGSTCIESVVFAHPMCLP